MPFRRPLPRLTDENAPTIAVICQRLDGLPLALELAVSRIRLFPPHALLQHLDQRFVLLVNPLRDAPDRQKTLRDMVQWSCDLLSADQQRLYRTLSVFRGGWTLDAMLWMTKGDGDRKASEIDAVTLLDPLMDHSLIGMQEQLDETPLYSMLEATRAFGVEQLDAHGEGMEVGRGMPPSRLALLNRQLLPFGERMKTCGRRGSTRSVKPSDSTRMGDPA